MPSVEPTAPSSAGLVPELEVSDFLPRLELVVVVVTAGNYDNHRWMAAATGGATRSTAACHAIEVNGCF
jgi:hypothetical protein